ncbi:MAG: hypothetical protein R2822_11675 [Spirosomataceae bacterium]
MVEALTNGIGADGVIVASAKDDTIISQAARMSRNMGVSLVLVGVIGLHLSRAEFYEKSCLFRYHVLMAQAATTTIMSKRA